MRAPILYGQLTAQEEFMSGKQVLNRHQKRFFHKLRSHPKGLPPEQWPSAIVLQRWMTQPLFVERMESEKQMRDMMVRLNAQAAAITAISSIQSHSSDSDAHAGRALRRYKMLCEPAKASEFG